MVFTISYYSVIQVFQVELQDTLDDLEMSWYFKVTSNNFRIYIKEL